jgi:hypothetical protein
MHLHALAALPLGEEPPVPIPFSGVRNLIRTFGRTPCNASTYRGQKTQRYIHVLSRIRTSDASVQQVEGSTSLRRCSQCGQLGLRIHGRTRQTSATCFRDFHDSVKRT